MARRALGIAGVLTAVLVGCASPAAQPTSSPAVDAVESASPTPTAPGAVGFAVPKQCTDLVSPAMEASLAARGAGTQVQVFSEIPLGQPFETGDPAGSGLATGTVTNYLLCDWGSGDALVEVFLAAVDGDTYGPWTNEINFWGYGAATTADGLAWSSDGDVTDSAGTVVSNIGSADYWILRQSSMIKVQVRPGSPAALREAISIANDVAVTAGAN